MIERANPIPEETLPPTRIRLNRLIEMFEAGAMPVGTFAFNATLRSAAALTSSALDFVVLDLEHTPLGMKDLELYLLSLIDKARLVQKRNLQPDLVPLVRLPSYGWERLHYMMKQALDLGVFGVVAPCIETVEQARSAVEGMRFAHAASAADAEPQGRRGVGYPWAARYWGVPGPEYAERADLWPLDTRGELLLWCMIESRTGLENCRTIARTVGVSGVLIGPSDLSMSLEGRKGGTAVFEAIETIRQICQDESMLCGLAVSSADAAQFLDAGFDFLIVGDDTGIPAEVEAAARRAREMAPRRLMKKSR